MVKRQHMTWTLRKKILIGYGIVLALTVAILVRALLSLLALGQASDAILRENYRSIQAAESMINAIERQDSSTLLVVAGYAPEGLTQFRRNEFEFLEWLGRAKDNITLPGEKQVLQTISKGYQAYLETFLSLDVLKRAHRTTKASQYYHHNVLPRFKAVRNACMELRDMNQQAMTAASEHAQKVSHYAVSSMLLIGTLLAAVGLTFSLLLSSILVKPLHAMTEATERITQGDYDVSLSAKSKDELGSLARKIMVMSRKLKAYHELNVQQLLAAKKRNEAIIDSIPDGLIMVDAELHILAVNPRAARIFGHSPEQVRDRHFFDVVKNQQLYDHVKTVAERRQLVDLSEEEATLAIGENEQVEYYRFSITPVETERRQVLGIVLLLQNVTKLKELDRLKGEFVMTASHELRTPLTSIAMSIDLLMESARPNLAEKQQQLLDAAHEEVQRLRALVNDLLDLSKIEAGRVEMEFATLEVSIPIRKACSVFTRQAAEQQVELTCSVPEQLDQIKADPNKITWVLTNLISNALRYTNPGGHIKVLAEELGDFMYLSVADDGEGIAPEYQSRIFDKFVQVKGEKAVGGSGLGLAIAREIVKAHGGTIWLNSIPGQGSTFTFTLPVVDRDHSEQAKGVTEDEKSENFNRG